MDDFKKFMYTVIVLFGLVIVGWVSFLALNACGFDAECHRAGPIVLRTPIPTLVPGTLPAQPSNGEAGASQKCAVKAVDLLGAWASAGSPETETFPFVDVNGEPCAGTFEADVAPLFSQSNIWFPASVSCNTCHESTLGKRSAGLDLTSYAGILSGSGRASVDVTHGRDLFGGGAWENSLLFKTLTRVEGITDGHPPLAYAAANLTVYVGRHVFAPAATVP